jgi:hypothetical protein
MHANFHIFNYPFTKTEIINKKKNQNIRIIYLRSSLPEPNMLTWERERLEIFQNLQI